MAFAGEQTLEFKLVTTPVDVKVVEAANIDGQTMSAGQYFGVAYFKDGRIAVKNFVATKVSDAAGKCLVHPFCPQS
jgi:hypothetical protein